ncbi:MAG: M48 family metallopeptidase [Candidatus Diapherotrites archaeon]|uniref:Protease HtpX homolog n=1 Tax=Candidatus Iainarchaeum sp. TaxID=3101447 RepID=A0A7J4IV26_9ARCH|nr:MAG: heat shock protein HtpX [archaeon GW2011_AR10]MBS3059338.1 M48 family metallopeptidase [Candidatus Diapherotrites archaeon]HIH08209.1 M48 family metallopeptidase [Candidatus Diapherotrites archaeon]
MYEQIAENNRNTLLLVTAFSVFIIALAWVLGEMWFSGGGFLGIIVGTIFLIIYLAVDYFFADKIVLSISGAREAKKAEHPYLYSLIDGLAVAAGIPKPKAYVIDDTALNAFATGRNPERGVIVVTTGILEKMNRQELEGIIAHEMSHIKNYDIRLMTLIVVLVGLTALLSDILLRSVLWGKNRNEGRAGIIMLVLGVVLAILTPIVAAIIRFAVSRQREYLADADSAMLTRNPDGLASALSKIAGDKEVLEAANKATAHLYIDNPLKNRQGFLDNLFSTHPPIADRIKRLQRM